MKKNSQLDVEIKKITHWQKRIFDNFGIEIPVLSCRCSEELRNYFFELAKKRGMKHIKLNIPENEESYNNGNGEGVWVLVDANTKKAYDSDEEGTNYTGILDNDSYNYKGLVAGTTIPFEMRGEMRPIVPYKWLVENYKIKKNKWANRI